MTISFSNFLFENLQPKTEFEKSVVTFLEEWFSASKTLLVQTSGSTGTPKLIEVEKEKMLNSAKMTCDFLHLKEGDSALLCLPIQYISGKMMLVRAIERKLNITIEEPKTTVNIGRKKYDFCAMTPLQVQNSLGQIHVLKKLIIGGAAVSEKLKKQLYSINPETTRIFESYGMTETLSHIALKEIYPDPQEYFAILNEVKISVDESNCLQISAPKLNPKVLQTRDIVELKNEKEFKFLGRLDNVINSGGVKIYAESIENELKKVIPNELVFMGKKDEVLGEKLIVVLEGEEDEVTKQKIINFPFENKFHQPKEIIFLPQFPRSENGKVLRKEIIKLI